MEDIYIAYIEDLIASAKDDPSLDLVGCLEEFIEAIKEDAAMNEPEVKILNISISLA